jgi:hypothetical protein
MSQTVQSSAPRSRFASIPAVLVVLSVLVVVAGLAAPPAQAVCEVGLSFGSTVLYPYFEVDLSNPSGLTTLLSINNEAPQPTLTRAVVWTNWGIPVLAFDIYLRARDLQTINVRDLLNGTIPSTGTGSNLSGFPGCVANPPSHANPVLAPLVTSQLRAYLTGVPGPGDALCASEPFGDNHARGYITIDSVGACSGVEATNPVVTPVAASYFTSPAIVFNSLWGDLFYVDSPGNSAQAVEAINLVGDAAGFVGPNVMTFYGRFNNWDGRDKRSPLPEVWTSRFLNGGPFDGGTDLIVYRDTRSPAVGKRSCAGHPVWHPLISSFLTARDEEANAVLQLSANSLFPIATQRVSVASDIAPPVNFGRVQIGFDTATGGSSQAWVLPVMTASERYSVDFNAQPLATNCGVVFRP